MQDFLTWIDALTFGDWVAFVSLIVALIVGFIKKDKLFKKTIKAEKGSVALGDNASHNNVTINDIDLIKQAMKETLKGFDTDQKAAFDQLTKKLDVTEAALKTFFSILKKQDVPADKLSDVLAEIARQHNTAVKRLDVLECSSKECYQQCKTDPLPQLKSDPVVSHWHLFKRCHDFKRRTYENTDFASTRYVSKGYC